MSTIETISAIGNFIRPLIIFKGENPQNTWLPEQTPDWCFTTLENGWISNFIAIQGLKNIFIPETRPEMGSHRLSIMDGYGSYTSTEVLRLCKQNNIKLLFLSAHSSHVLQPLDLGVFAPRKSWYRTQIAELAQLGEAAAVKNQRFVSCYYHACIYIFNDLVPRSFLKAAGLFPLNADKNLNSS